MIVIPQTATLDGRRILHGARAAGKDPLFIDAAQTYLIGGGAWAHPLTLGQRIEIPSESGGELVREYVRFPMLLPPGCGGLSWRGRACVLDISGTENQLEQIAMDVYDPTNIGSPINAFQSIVEATTVESLPRYTVTTGTLEQIASESQGWPVVGPHPQWYPVPPEVPTPGVIQITPVRSYRHVVVELGYVGIGWGWLEVRPIVSVAPLAGMETY